MFDITGWWVIFPIIGLVLMLLMISRMFGFWSRRDRRKGEDVVLELGGVEPCRGGRLQVQVEEACGVYLVE